MTTGLLRLVAAPSAGVGTLRLFLPFALDMFLHL